MKKIWQRALCLVMALLLVPALAPADLAAALPMTTAHAADTIIASAQDWNSFVTSGTTSGTVYLTQDITLSGAIPTKKNFYGTFDGQGHTITLADGSVLTGDSTVSNVGLFCNLSWGATVKNLVVRVDGMVNATSLKSIKLTQGDQTDLNIFQCGVVAGEMQYATLSRVAVVAGDNGGTYRAVINRWQTDDGNVGGLCGLAYNSTIEECYMGVNVQSWRMIIDSANAAVQRTGGLTAFSTGSKINNCMVASCEIRNYHSNPDYNENGCGQAAALVTGVNTGTVITNCIMDGVKIYSHDIAETTAGDNAPVEDFDMNSNRRGTAGLVYAYGSTVMTISSCYAYGDTMIQECGRSESANAITGQDAANTAKLMLAGSNSSTWLVDSKGRLGLSWMFQKASIGLEPTSNGRDVQITVSQQEPVIPNSPDTTWSYTLKASLQGKYGTPEAPTIAKGQEPVVSEITIMESRKAPESDGRPNTLEHYSGGTYQFYAKLKGTNLTSDNAVVTWALKDVPVNDDTPAATIDPTTGRLTVSEMYFGTLTLTASVLNISTECVLTILPAKLTILVPDSATEVERGKQIDLGAKYEGYFADLSKTPYEVNWTVTGKPIQAGTKIDPKTGLLTVDPNEGVDNILTVTAKLDVSDVSQQDVSLLQDQSVSLTVIENTTPAQVGKEVNPTQAGQRLPVDLTTGQKLLVSLSSTPVTPQTPDGYEADGQPTLEAKITSGSEYLSKDTGNGFLFAAQKAGTATITVTRTFNYKKQATTEPEPEPGTGASTNGSTAPSAQADGQDEAPATTTIKLTSTITVTITDPQVPTAQDQVVKMAEVAGSTNTATLDSTQVDKYSLNFPAGAAGRQYQLTITDSGAEPAYGSSWSDLGEDARSVALDSAQTSALKSGTLCLWLRQQASGSMGASSVAGYTLKEEDGKPVLEAMAAHPAVPQVEPKDLTLTGTWTVQNGEVQGGPTFNVLDLIKTLDPSLSNYTSLDTGEVRVTVSQTGGNYANLGEAFTVETSAAIAVGNAMLKPTIQPRENGQLTGNSFTIDVPDQSNSAVYYKVYTDQTTVDPDEYPDPGTDIGQKYNAGDKILYPVGKHESVTVVAITYSTDVSSAIPPSEADIVTFTKKNLEAPVAPQLRIGDADFAGGNQYKQGEKFEFVYDVDTSGQANAYQVYYTTDGTDPVAETPEQLYDPADPPTLDFGYSLSRVEIRAIVYNSNYGVSSSVASFVVERLSTSSKPTATVANGSLVRPGEVVYLELAEDFVEGLPQIGNFVSAQYAEYSADSPVYAAFADYTRRGADEPIEGVRYLLIDTGTSVSTTQLPEIYYLLNNPDGSLESDGIPYRYALCQVWTIQSSTGEPQKYISFTNPDPITLSGVSGDTFTLRAATCAPEGVSSYLDSEEATFNYTIRGTLPAPGAVPTTDAQGSTAVDIGEGISLTSAANTEIYYTTDGIEPQVTWVETDDGGHWELGNASTQKYEGTIYVPNNNTKLFILNAIAVSVNDTMENSPLASFVYSVNPLPQAAAPVANPATDGTQPTQLSNGERISLTTTTLNTDIYYTIDGSVPSYETRDAWEAGYAAAAEKGENADGTRWYTDAGGVQQTEPATRIYDVQQGITMAATEQSPFFTVTAMAVDKDRTTPAASASNAASFVYRLAQVVAPTGSPATSETEVAVVEPGTTIVLTSGTVGAKIYYTKDTTMPDVTDTDAVDQAYADWYKAYSAAAEANRGSDGKGVRWYKDSAGAVHNEPSTIPYDLAEGITMPKTISTFLTLRAVAVVDDGSRAASDVVTISYQPPAPVQAVYASPMDGTALEYGTAVTLSCATEGAQIFYKVYTSAPKDGDVPVANKDLGYTEPIPVTKEVWIRAIAVRSNVESVVTTYHYTVAPTAEAPTATLPSGSVVPKGTRIRLDGDGNIIYTLDGSDPKDAESEKLYGNTLTLDGEYGATVAVRAYTQKDGCTPSDTVSFNYTICKEEDYLTISVDSGSVVPDGTAVTLSTAITNGRIFYTLDGSTPQVAAQSGQTYRWTSGSSATIEGSGFTLTGAPDSTAVVRAIVVVDGAEGGQVQTFTYKFQPQAAPPTASIPSGAVVFAGATVTLTAKEGTIYYTTDGTTPTTSSAVYSSAIDVSANGGAVLKAIAVVDGKAASEVAEFRYTRAGQVGAPVFSIPSGEIDMGTTVTITSSTQGAVIYYSTDGTEPSSDNLKELTMYVAPIAITRAVTIKAIAVSDKLDDSAVQSATYTVKKPESQPTPTPETDQTQNTVTDRLTSRRTYNSTEDGPAYSDVVLRETASNTVLSAKTGVVPDTALLTVKQVEPSRSDETSVKSSLGQQIARVYETQLTVDGDSVTPAGEFELGFAIPAEYQNGVVTISRINDDGTLTQYTARRSGGMAYINTTELGRFALSVPQTSAGSTDLFTALLWAGGAAAAALGLILVFLYRRRRKEEAEAAAAPAANAEDYQSLEDFFEPSDI